MSKKFDLGREFELQARRCDDERRRIREQLYRMGYPPMTLEEAERIAKRLTVRH